MIACLPRFEILAILLLPNAILRLAVAMGFSLPCQPLRLRGRMVA